MRFLVALIPLLAVTTLARVTVNPDQLCSVVNGLVTAVHEKRPATLFCSSYLHLTEKTITTVTTPSTAITVTVTSTTSTTTSSLTVANSVTITAPATTVQTVTATTTIPVVAGTTTVTSALTACGSPTLRKRGTVPKPGSLSRYSVSAVLSSACSCLHIPQITRTTTKTASISTQTSTVTQNVIATVFSIVSLVGTATISTTTTSLFTITSTVSSTTTATATAFGPIKIAGSTTNSPANAQRLLCPFSRPAQEYLCNFQSGTSGDSFISRPDGRISDLNRVPNTDFNFLGISGFSGNYRNYIAADANSFNGDPQMSCQILPGTSGACPMECTLTDLYGNTDTAMSLCSGGLWWVDSDTKSGCSPLSVYAMPVIS